MCGVAMTCGSFCSRWSVGRLLLKDVERRAADVARLDRVGQRALRRSDRRARY